MSDARFRPATLAYHLVVGLPILFVYALLVVPAAWIRRLLKSALRRRPAVLWGPVPIINIRYSALADRLQGYRSDSLVYGTYHINSPADFDIELSRYRSFPLLGPAVPYFALVWASLRYDIFGFFFDGGLLAWTPAWWLELPLLRLAGKAVVVYPYGSDARLATPTRNQGRWNAYTDVAVGAEDRDERDVATRVRAVSRWANVVLGCADLVELPRLDGVYLYAFDQRGWTPVDAPDDTTVEIVHAPNHRHFKGTRYLIDAVAELQQEGYPVELTLVEGKPQVDARQIYERADIIVDQLLIGAYALFAIEAMALGKPVVCYLNDRFRPYHPEWDDCPIVSADPDTVTAVLRRLVDDVDLRATLGRRGPEYVRKYHSLEAVGARMDLIYRSLWPETAGPKA